MALSPGTRIGVYEIGSALGAGGMGEVYRATDTSLGREVAIKVLPEAFATDAERLARFEREARTLASLNHPNIAIVHGLERFDASTAEPGGAARALVMELVAGPTLAERLAKGPVPLDEALAIARQTADALEAAHEQGIVHRDLKPANVKLRPDGTVKVLDFGLAKALTGDGSHSAAPLSMSPTITAPAGMTGLGVILGTAAYMAPEQARGRVVDRRADLWAFGCVLYEMLSGRPAFDGEDVTAVLARVIERHPDYSALPANTPAPIKRLIRRCLEKDRKKRLADAADARLDIDDALTPPADEMAATSATVPAAPPMRRWVVAASAAVVVAIAAAGYTGWKLRPPAGLRPLTRLTIALPEGEFFTGVNSVAISPDGTRVVYTANARVYMRALDQLEPRVIGGNDAPPPAAARSPVFSPDGQWVAFWESGQLKKVSVSGGAAVNICALTPPPIGLHWTADGTILIGRFAQGIWRVPSGGGTAASVIEVAEGERATTPQLLPDGRTVLFTVARTASFDDAHIVVQTIGERERKTIVAGGTDGRYLPTGHLLYGLRGTMLALPFDPSSLTVSGGPTPVVEGVWQPGGAQPYAQLAVSSDGTLVYGPPSTSAAALRTLVWVDRDGREEAIDIRPRSYAHPRLSPDGTRVALHYPDDSQNVDVWVWDLVRSVWTRVTSDLTPDGEAVWTPDGEQLIFTSRRSTQIALYRQAASGGGHGEQIAALSRQANVAPARSSDGRYVVIRASSDGSSYLALLDFANALREPGPPLRIVQATPLLRTEFEEYNADISPDGRWIAYTSNESGAFEVHVRPFPDVMRGRWTVSRGGGSEPLWSRDGRELFYRTPDRGLMRVEVTSGSTWAAGAPALVFAGSSYALGPVGNAAIARTYDVSPDGKRFLMLKNVESDSTQARRSPHLIVVQSWFDELKRLVPR